jgi:hypothetical protein
MIRFACGGLLYSKQVFGGRPIPGNVSGMQGANHHGEFIGILVAP